MKGLACKTRLGLELGLELGLGLGLGLGLMFGSGGYNIGLRARLGMSGI